MSSLKSDVIWSPVQADKFITFGNDLRLYQVEEGDFKEETQKTVISEKTVAILHSVNTDYQYIKCVSWYPKLDWPQLLAVGQANGTVVLTSFGHMSDLQNLAGREYAPRHARQCNCVAWNPVEHNLLVSGLDRNRSECGILVWDINRPAVHLFSNEITPTHERRHSSNTYVQPTDISHSNISPGSFKPQTEIGLSDTAHSLHWFLQQPKTLICGVNNKHIKIFDLRDSSKHQNATPTKAVHGVCVDPYFEHRLASFVENQVMIWDIRNFEKPVVTLNEAKPLLKLSWSPKRCNLLASLTKDSNLLKLYDIQQAHLNSDDIEPTVVERIVQPQGPPEIGPRFY